MLGLKRHVHGQHCIDAILQLLWLIALCQGSDITSEATLASLISAETGGSSEMAAGLAQFDVTNGPRNFKSMLVKQLPVQPYVVDVPMINDGDLGHKNVPVAIVLPHEIFAAAYAKGPTVFRALFLSSAASASQFWDHARCFCTDWYNTIMTYFVGFEFLMSYIIPLTFHIDGVKLFGGGESGCCYSWQTFAIKGSSLLRQLFAIVPEHLMVPGVTEEFLIKIWSWSLRAMMEGKWPECDHLGNPWPPGTFRCKQSGKILAGLYRAAFVFLKADLKQRVQCFGLSRWYRCNFCCERCFAHQNVAGLSPADFRDSAGWLATVLKHDFFDLRNPELQQLMQYVHWFRVPGFLYLFSVVDDLMHHLYLGSARDLCASIIINLLENDELPGYGLDPNLRLKALWLLLRDWCKIQGTPFKGPVFTLTSLGRTTKKMFPKLDSQIKAAHTKALIYYLGELCCDKVRLAPDPSPHSELRAACVHLLCRALKIWDAAGPLLSSEEAQESSKCLMEHLKMYQCLAQESMQANVVNWKMRPKCHYLGHLSLFVSQYHLNPRWTHNFAEEDFMGKVSKICKKQHRSTYPVTAPISFLLQMTVKWSKIHWGTYSAPQPTHV